MSAGPRTLRRWLLSLGGVLAAHAALVAALLCWPPRERPPPPAAPAQALMLELAPAPTAPAAPPTDVPPGPPQPEQRQAPRVRAPRPAPPQPPPQPLHADLEEAQPSTPAQDPPQASSAAQASAPPSVAAAPASRYAATQSLSGAAQQRRATWQAQVLGHLQRYKRYPRPAQRRRQEGVVQVQFAVDRRGHASAIRIVQGSGHDALDSETLATVQRASPLPAPPPEIEGDPVQVVVPVDFFLRER
ncbi:energy transducer TonB [Xanthomonas bonasiae]|uniref:energy transducer TonB n=1 Tax=Xanthomonas bonasiae TaxID=2810351 RepID=UPI00177BEFCF|nr:energy transducer TonB [Xanthomonas surreyensis]MBD7921180.1 energy transducer TonB [Xanthomonas surreyensis]